MLRFAPHPLLVPTAFITEFTSPLGELQSPPELLALHQAQEEGGAAPPEPFQLPDEPRERLRQDVRDLLRHGGHKPTGRGKPSAEYLVKARIQGKIPAINLAVDACNAASVHTGLPISVVDLARTAGPLEVRVPTGGSYVFNASGQEIALQGLLCLCDETGPIANAVKDSHGTKTSPATQRTLSVIWAPKVHAAYVEKATRWYRSLLEAHGNATTSDAEPPSTEFSSTESSPAEPSPSESAHLDRSRRALANLEDDSPRSIEHTLRFPSKEAADLCLEAIEMMGFQPSPSEAPAAAPTEAQDETRFPLRVTRTDPTSLKEIHAVVMHLAELCAPYDGDHVGWTPAHK